ncbi:MAG: hypothetical protein U5J83_18945 [Bryobacterales bacterium]|nr:hypothetical protein [Bryobacterales bacterium]
MKLPRRAIFILVLFVIVGVTAFAFQRRFRYMNPEEDAPIPENPTERTEFVFARLQYPQINIGGSLGAPGKLVPPTIPKRTASS